MANYSQKLPVLAVLACVFLISASSTQSFAQDYSKSYNYGAVLKAPSNNLGPQGRDIINVSGNVEAGGVLGCSGLDLDALVEGQLGGIGNIGDLSKDIANAAKTRMFNEALTQLFSDPQVASVLEGMQGMAQARLGMLQKNCNANEIYADATNKRLRGEAMSRCVAERRSMEDCSQPEILTEYLGNVIESPRWSEDLHTQMCDSEERDNCDWTVLVPNKRTEIDSRGSSDADEDGDEDADDDSDDDSGDDSGDETSEDEAVVPAAQNGEEVAAAISPHDIIRLAYDNALEDVVERVIEARRTIDALGYSAAMRAVLYDQPGMPEEIEEYIAEQRERVNDGEITAEEMNTPSPYTFYQYRTNEACEFSFTTQNNFTFDLTPIIGALPETPATDPGDDSGDDSGDGDDTPPSEEPQPVQNPSPPQTGDNGRGNVVFPIPGQTNEEAVVTSYYNQTRGRPAGATRPHVGIDYRARGKNILAVFDGRAAHGRSPRCGDLNLTRNINGRNERFRYFHLSRVNGNVIGQNISAGTQVGRSGTRCAGAEHLHVEYYVDGVRRNPAILLGFSQYKHGGTTDRFATAQDRRLAGSSLSGFAPDLGTNPHGDESLAAVRAGLPADHPFVIALQNQMDALAIRVSNTAKCMTNKLFHPQVYVKMAMLPGDIGFVGDDAPAEVEPTEENMAYDLRGDSGAMVNGIAQMISYDAAVATYNATILEMAQAVAIKGSESASGMNPELYEYARGQLALLKFRRSTMITDYVAQCEMSERISGLVDRRQELDQGARARNSRQFDTSVSKTFGYDCYKYDHLVDEGLSDLRNLYSGFKSTGAVAPMNGGTMPADPDAEINCLALNIYHEARGESAAGQEAVARVTMARRNHPSYPGTVCGVVWQPRQFSWTHDRNSDAAMDREALARALEIARRVQSEEVPVDYTNITAYHTITCQSQGCNDMRNNPRLQEAFRVGDHVFYRERG